MINWLRHLLSCKHNNLSRVFTDEKTKCSHVICFDCAERYEYNWNTMELGERIPAPRARRWNDGLEQA